LQRRYCNSCSINNNNNIPSVIPLVGSGKGGVYATLPLPYEGREGISNRVFRGQLTENITPSISIYMAVFDRNEV